MCTIARARCACPITRPRNNMPYPFPQLVEVAPRLGQLRQLLWRAPYGLQDEQEEQGKGEEGQGEQGGGAAGWTFDQLLDEVQVSEWGRCGQTANTSMEGGFTGVAPH